MNLRTHYDVVVLGAGPAGLAAAISIRSKIDVSVLVVDAATPNHERVGESCPPDTVLLLKQLGVAREFYRAGHDRCPGYASVWGRSDPGYNDFIVNPLGPAWRLRRDLFDSMLATEAQRKGAEVIWSTRFLDREENGKDGQTHTLCFTPASARASVGARLELKVRASFVIDATGQKARFAHAMGIDRSREDQLVAVIRFAKVVEGRVTDQVLLEAVPEGWWYQARLPDRRLVTMVVVEKEGLPRLRREEFQGFAQALSATQFIRRHAENLRLEECRYHIRLIAPGMLRRADGRNWMAIGDAASSFDPIAAQGIYKGLRHGLLTGAKVSATFKGEGTQTGTGDGSFSELVHREYVLYRRNREHVYGLERRWPDASFWRKRQAAFGSGIESDMNK